MEHGILDKFDFQIDNLPKNVLPEKNTLGYKRSNSQTFCSEKICLLNPVYLLEFVKNITIRAIALGCEIKMKIMNAFWGDMIRPSLWILLVITFWGVWQAKSKTKILPKK